MVECVHINKQSFLDSLTIKEIADVILLLAYEYYAKENNMESLVKETSERDFIMFSDDDDDLDMETFKGLLSKHNIAYRIEIQ